MSFCIKGHVDMILFVINHISPIKVGLISMLQNNISKEGSVSLIVFAKIPVEFYAEV